MEDGGGMGKKRVNSLFVLFWQMGKGVRDCGSDSGVNKGIERERERLTTNVKKDHFLWKLSLLYNHQMFFLPR